MSMSEENCWNYDWPKESLESVSSCPACGCNKSELLLENLVDNAFFVAPAKWTLYECKECKSAYLNPRPDQSSIHKAYGTYYTHEASSEEEMSADSLGLIQRVKSLLSNGYYNYHHGTKREPFLTVGAWLLLLYPKFRKSANAKFRYLQKPELDQKLLDVGCGNGDYLSLASEAGWEVKGVEPDLKALEVAKNRGLDVVQGSLEEIVKDGELFDVITMSHVIEHVHDPVAFVALAYECLKPGGSLYIDTPNIQSAGAKRFGKNWRGIETPRHLVLFSEAGLDIVLKRAGFSGLYFFPRQEVRESIALKSYRMELGKSPYDASSKRLPFKEIIRCRLPRRYSEEEFLTLIAKKV